MIQIMHPYIRSASSICEMVTHVLIGLNGCDSYNSKNGYGLFDILNRYYPKIVKDISYILYPTLIFGKNQTRSSYVNERLNKSTINIRLANLGYIPCEFLTDGYLKRSSSKGTCHICLNPSRYVNINCNHHICPKCKVFNLMSNKNINIFKDGMKHCEICKVHNKNDKNNKKQKDPYDTDDDEEDSEEIERSE